MTGLYELFFGIFSADVQLQTALGGTALDKKVYPVQDLGRLVPPGLAMAEWSDRSDVPFGIERPLLDLYIVSNRSATEVVSISSRIEALINRKRLEGSGLVVHLCVKDYEHDDFDEEALEFTRDVRYRLIVK